MSDVGHTKHSNLVSRTIRMLALVEMAEALRNGETALPGEGESTDRDDKFAALLHALRAELQSMQEEVSHA